MPPSSCASARLKKARSATVATASTKPLSVMKTAPEAMSPVCIITKGVPTTRLMPNRQQLTRRAIGWRRTGRARTNGSLVSSSAAVTAAKAKVSAWLVDP